MYEGMSADQIIQQMYRTGMTQEGVNAVYRLRGLGSAPTLPANLVGAKRQASKGGVFFIGPNGRVNGGSDFLNTFNRQAIDPFREYNVGNYLGLAGLLVGGYGAGQAIAAGANAANAGNAASNLGYFSNGGAGGLTGLGGGNAGQLAASGAITGGAGTGGTIGGALGGFSPVANMISGVGGAGGVGSAVSGGTGMGWLDTLIDVAPEVIGAYMGHDAAGDAADIQARGAEEAIAETRRQYDQNREDLAPYRQAGSTAIGQLSTGTVDGGDFNRDFTMADFEKDPGYEFRLNEGRRALEGSAAAGSGIFNGGVGRRLERYGQDYASGEFSNAYNRFNNDRNTRFNRLAAIAGVGQTATNTGVNAGESSSRAVSDSIIGAANAAAAGRVGEANAVTGGLESLGDYYRNRRYGGQPRTPG
jgi:hypothetical protein